MSDALIAARCRKADQALRSRQALLQDGDMEGACNRAYYAMFHAAHVALECAEVIPPGTIYKTHGGLIATFNKELVLTGRIDVALGRALSKVHDVRLLADYAGDSPDAATTAWAIEQADAFLLSIRLMLPLP